ncbi:hypothetical protein [Calycomorphotria hydatis]|uniref:Carboxypeptidase regulatory-like domain-containing protein n=1 Tax=Calycomorphotria hydatis TaxID=2528027 RepID=A0A517TBK2_9PLAN|nr:hypothetical protein [Calycomorphotria hydatis]QDT65751.1 hypothetical protein V22_30110 [Calycomorphotria hydatis]
MITGRISGWMLCLVVLALGCGASEDEGKLPVVPASGTITVPGMETAGLTLLFLPADTTNTNAWSTVGADGRFDISTYDPGDGAAVGKYKVIISGGEGPLPEDDPRLAKIPAQYKDRDQTSWEIEITSDADSNHFDLSVE